MLTKARFRNFQKLTDLTVRFGPRVTVLVGATEAGKSTALRALQFVFFSKWKPAYHRHGKTTTTSEVWIDGHRVVRRKGKGVNSYTLDGKKLSAVGKGGVPPEVAALFGLTPANVQSQLDPPFWFMETPGTISKKLNKIVNLELIDETQARASAGCREAEHAVRAAKQLVQAAANRLKETEWIDGFVTAGERVVRLGKAAADAREGVATLEIPTRAARTSLKAGIRVKRALIGGETALRAASELGRIQNTRRHLEKQINGVRRAKQDATLTVPDLEPLLKVRAAADLVAEERRHLEFMLKDTEEAGEVCDNLAGQLGVWEMLLKEARKKEMVKCPVCKSSVPRSAISTHGRTAHGAGKRRTGSG